LRSRYFVTTGDDKKQGTGAIFFSPNQQRETV
jgi:hypothetical protein